MADVLILGAGMVGAAMAFDLAAEPDVAVHLADRSLAALGRARERIQRVQGRSIETIEADLADPDEIARLAGAADVILGALPSAIGFQTLRAVISAGRPYVDISFMPQNAMELDEEAQRRGVSAIVDCGVAPGLSNFIAGLAADLLDPCESIDIFVGGVPAQPRWPFNYKAAFAPRDVIEEYTRPARQVEKGRVVTKEALSEPEILEFPSVPGGVLEAFNTDGLRTLIDNLLPRLPGDVDLREKTLRYPGHAELMRIFRETGLFSTEPVDVDGASVRPLELTSKLLFPKWMYSEGEVDLTVMRIIARGRINGRPEVLVWELTDRADLESGLSSMSRTTAFPATFMARELLAGRIGQAGILPPERLAGVEHLSTRLFQALRLRRVELTEPGAR